MKLLSVHRDGAGGRLKLLEQKLDQRGFSGSAVSDQKNELAFLDRKAHIVQRRYDT